MVAVFGQRRLRHWGEPSTIAFSPDGKHVASAGSDNVVRVWDARTGAEVAVLKGHESRVYAVAFSPNGRRLASGGGDTTVVVWETNGWRKFRTLRGHTHAIYSLSFTPHGRTLASGAAHHEPRIPSEIKLWDVDSGKVGLTLAADAGAVVAFRPDGEVLATGTASGSVRLWDVGTGKARDVLEGHKGPVRALAWTANGRMLVSGGDDGAVRRWDPDRRDNGSGDKEQAPPRFISTAVYGVAISPDGRRLAAVGANGALKVWDTEAGAEPSMSGDCASGVAGVAFDARGRTLAIARFRGDIHLWDFDTAEERFPLRGHMGAVFELAFSADGLTLASVGQDNTVRLWDVLTAEQRASFAWGAEPPRFSALAFSPDGKLLAVGNEDGRLRLRSLTAEGTSVSLGPFSYLEGHASSVLFAAFAADGETLFSGSWDLSGNRESQVRQWDLTTRKLRGSLLRLPIPGRVVIAPEGRRVAVGILGGARVWDLDTGKERLALEGQSNAIFSLDFTRDGKRLASGSYASVVVWDVDTGTVLDRRSGHGTGWVECVALSPDGNLVASRGADNRVVVWNIARKRQVVAWPLPGPVYRLAFAPDGRHLATANANGTIFLLRLPSR